MSTIDRQIGAAMDYVFVTHRIPVVELESMKWLLEPGERKS